MPIKKFHHLAIICSDYAVSKRFYTEILGFEIVSEEFRESRNSYLLFLAIPGGGQIELFSFPEPPKRLSYPEACGLRHLAFSVNDLDAFAANLLEQGIDVEAIRVDVLEDTRYTFFFDPDGLPIELREDGPS